MAARKLVVLAVAASLSQHILCANVESEENALVKGMPAAALARGLHVLEKLGKYYKKDRPKKQSSGKKKDRLKKRSKDSKKDYLKKQSKDSKKDYLKKQSKDSKKDYLKKQSKDSKKDYLKKQSKKDSKGRDGTCKGGSSCPNPCGVGADVGGDPKYHQGYHKRYKHCSDGAKFLYCKKGGRKCKERDCDPGTVWNEGARRCLEKQPPPVTTPPPPAADMCAVTAAKLKDLHARCIEPGAIYSASSQSGVIHKITLAEDGASGTSDKLFAYGDGGLDDKLFDVAISSSGEAYGVAGGISVVEVDFCGKKMVATGITETLPFASGMFADFTRAPHLREVYVQGIRLLSIDTDSFTFASVGPKDGDNWCAGSAGDMVLDPADGLVYSAVSSCGCGPRDYSALIKVDPATGNQVSLVGCFTENGEKVEKVLGMAIDGLGRIVVGTESSTDLFAVDKDTAALTRIPVSGAYDGTDGLASIPCAKSW